MPFRFFRSCRGRSEFEKLEDEKELLDPPPRYHPTEQVKLEAAAEASLHSALSEFRDYHQYARSPPEGNWQVTTGAVVRRIEINLAILDRTLEDKEMRPDRLDWYTEMVVDHKTPYNHPELLSRLYGLDEPR